MKIFALYIVLGMILWSANVSAQNAGRIISAKRGMIVSASEEASKVGVQILKRGGNAVDAAVAIGFALAVTYPSAGNIGGGTYLIVRMADGRESAIDAREKAPAAATRTMYMTKNGEIIPDKSLRGPISAGVPGTVDGLLTAHEMYGTIKREELLEIPIQLAKNGFVLKKYLSDFISNQKKEFMEFTSSMKVFTKEGRDYKAGEKWKQPDLAGALERIAQSGRQGFYSGLTAELIIRQMKYGGGIISQDDLDKYRSIVRTPVRGTYRGYDILSMPPSSSGGIALIQLLNILEGFDIRESGFGSIKTIHVMVEAMRRVYADRAKYLGDPEYIYIPQDTLLSKEYAEKQRMSISMTAATPSEMIYPEMIQPREGIETTHYSVVDRWGNAVAVTTTLNSVCGSKCVVEGAGFLLNNEMDDFSIKPGFPNQFGLIGNEANSIQPGKRMLSSMTPTIMLKDDKIHCVLGSPGGSKIITSVLGILLSIIDHKMSIDQALEAPRIHHQWIPDSIMYEKNAIRQDIITGLSSLGHTIKETTQFGRVEIIQYDKVKKRYIGCSDPRGHGSALGY